jgi:hypothetical protein
LEAQQKKRKKQGGKMDRSPYITKERHRMLADRMRQLERMIEDIKRENARLWARIQRLERLMGVSDEQPTD